MRLQYSGVLLLAGLVLSGSDAVAQKKLIRKLFSAEKDTTRASSFLPLPALSYAQETGFAFGLVTLYSFYTNRKDTVTRSSVITGTATLTTKKQSFFTVKADIWSPGNTRHTVSDLRYRNFSFNFYGTGSNTAAADKDVVVQKLFRIQHEIERRFGKSNYAGINASFEHYDFRDMDAGGIFDGPVAGKSGGKALFIGASYSFDNRNSNTYTTVGSLFKVNYSYAPGLWGGGNFKGGLLKLDARKFTGLSKKIVLGGQLVHQGIAGSTVPFYLLPQLGNDQLMRGYYTGRYRDKKLFAGQAELRYRFIPRLGVAAFAGFGKVSASGDVNFTGIKPNYGAGGRYFFDVERGLSVRVDYGVGEKRPGEERQKGVYISLGEAF